MTFENGWVKFFREQYPTGSRIKLRDLENTRAPRKMGTLESIEDDGTFAVRWDNGDVGHLMPGMDSFTVLQPEPVTLKLYMPLTAEVMHYDYWEGGDEDHSDLADREILAIEDEIVTAMVRNHTEEEAERGIMHWYGEDNSVDDKVRSVFFTAEEREGKLWGVAECRVVGELTPEELAELKDYISGQASDGWGEGFEQRPIDTDQGEVYVHLWSFDKDWSIQTEQERFGPEHDQTAGMSMGGM